MTITIHPVSPVLGAEIRGFDPCRPAYDPAEVETLRQALREHKVLLFRGFRMSPEDQVRLSEITGRLSYRNGIIYDSPSEKVTFVSNVHKDGLFGTGELSFHSDLAFTPHILKARSLYAMVLPSYAGAGGDTLFSDVTRACAELDPELRRRAEGLQARFAVVYPYEDGPVTVEFVRPLIDVHPETGKPFISASRAVTKEVIGMERSEFRPLLKALWAHIEEPRFIYRHRWQLDDCVLWDNIATQHSRTPFDPAEKRALRAVSIDDPAVAIVQPLTAPSVTIGRHAAPASPY